MSSQNFNSAYEYLNTQQKAAVDHIYGPLMVIAGPGTGKTQLLTLRIANILQNSDTNPQNILALTFTESGAVTMRQRLQQFIGVDAYKVHIHTFHSFCNTLIQENPQRFQFAKTLTAISDLDKHQIIKRILQETKFEHLYNRYDDECYLKDSIRIISDLKREDVSPDKLRELIYAAMEDIKHDENLRYKRKSGQNMPGDFNREYYNTQERLLKNREMAVVYEKYKEALIQNGLYDFDDMIAFVNARMQDDPSFLQELQEQFQFLLIDEYQDTSTSQSHIAYNLCQDIEAPNIMIVGDDEQSIYRFQGATMENIEEFWYRYQNEGAQMVVLKENYRSTQTILDASRSLIRNNQKTLEHRIPDLVKNLQANAGYPETLIKLSFPEDESIETFRICEHIQNAIQNGTNPKDIAILYRNHSDSVELVESLKRYGIPYKKQKGENLLHSPETQKLLRLLELSQKLENSELLWEVAHFDFIGIPTRMLLQAQNEAREHKISFAQSLWQSNETQIQAYIHMLEDLHSSSFNESLTQFFDTLLQKTQYREFILKKEEKLEKLNILTSLFNEIKRFAQDNPKAGIYDFISYLQDLEHFGISPNTQPIKTSENAINLMTTHGSKGLEFDYIYLFKTTSKRWEKKQGPMGLKLAVNLFDDKTERTKTDIQNENLEEERRLFYVALTRAKKGVHISAAQKYDGKDISPSQFIFEIPETFTQTLDNEDVDNEKLLETFTKDPEPVDFDALYTDELRTRADRFVLSVTALNTWIHSPKEFMENYLLRIPSAKPLPASFGTAVHGVLNMLSRFYKQNGNLPNKTEWQDYLDQILQNEGLSQKDYKKLFNDAVQVIQNYTQSNQSALYTNGESEVFFGGTPIVIAGMPIKGTVDKIEYTDNGEAILIDYKTGKSQKGKEQKEDYRRQLDFYRLLYENDTRKKAPLGYGALDYVEEATEDGPKRDIYPFDDANKEKLVEYIAAFKESLDNLYFPEKSLVLEA